MPPAVVAVAAAVAGAAASAGAAAALTGAVIAGITIGATAATIAGGIIGAVVSFGVSYAVRSLTGGGKSGSSAPSALSTATAQDSKVLIRAPISPRRVVYGKARVSGNIVYAYSHGTDQEKLTLIIALAGHPCSAVESVWFADEQVAWADLSAGNVVTGTYAGKVSVEIRLGNHTEAYAVALATSPDGWVADDKLSGMASIAVTLTYDRAVFAGGIPNISVTLFGKNDIQDPRPGFPDGITSNNWALVIRDYLTSPFGLAATADEIDEAFFIAAANLSDEEVDLNADGSLTQPRYTLNGSFTLDQAPIDIIGGMLASGGGALVYVAGKYRLYGGAYSSPTVTLTQSDFAGPIELITRPPRRDVFNSVRGTFINPAAFWQANEYPAIKDDAAIVADGEEIWREVEFPWITDATRAQRMARQILRRSRQTLSLRAPLRYTHIQLTVWQMVAVTFADFGWTAKPFRVVSWNFDPPTGGISVTLQEEQVNSYAWLYDAAELVPEVPDTTLVSPLNIPAPTSLSLTASTSLQADGTVAPAIIATWTAAAHPFVTSHEVQWRVQPSGAWSSLEVPSGTNRAVLAPVIVGVGYDVRVRAVGGIARSPWGSTASINGAPDTTAPGVPGGIFAAGVQRGFSITFARPSDPDLAAVEIWESPDNVATYQYVGESAGTGFLRSGASPLETRFFKARARDRSGNLSAFTSAVSAQAPRVVTDDITGGAVTTPIIAGGGASAFAFVRNNVAGASLARPGSGVATGELAGVAVTFDGDARALIFVRAPGVSATGGGTPIILDWEDGWP